MRRCAGYAPAQGADIRRGVEVIALDQDADGVTVTAHRRTTTIRAPAVWRAEYVIGADGAHSTVRDLVGADFPGKTVLSSVVLADVKLAHGPTDGGLKLGSTREVFGFLAPYGRSDADGSWYRAMVWDRDHQVPDTEPVANAEIVDVLTRAMKVDLGVLEVGWKSRFHCDERQVEQYRHGRVFLGRRRRARALPDGRAGHEHRDPGRGQPGLEDRRGARRRRRQTARQLSRRAPSRSASGCCLQSGLMARGVTLHPRLGAGVRNLLAPRLLGIPVVRDAVAGSFAGTTLRYRAGRRRPVGTRATEIPLREGRLTRLQRTAGFVLIREEGATPAGVPGVLEAERTDDGAAVLVRPDGYIAWVGPSSDREGLTTALGRWTGSQLAFNDLGTTPCAAPRGD